MSLWSWASNEPFVHLPDDTWVNMDQRRSDTDRGNPMDSERNLQQCHFVHHKFHMEWPGCEPKPPWEAGPHPHILVSSLHRSLYEGIYVQSGSPRSKYIWLVPSNTVWATFKAVLPLRRRDCDSIKKKITLQSPTGRTFSSLWRFSHQRDHDAMTTRHELSVVDFFFYRIAVASPQWDNGLTEQRWILTFCIDPETQRFWRGVKHVTSLCGIARGFCQLTLQ
jgi:hypothetical protein